VRRTGHDDDGGAAPHSPEAEDCRHFIEKIDHPNKEQSHAESDVHRSTRDANLHERFHYSPGVKAGTLLFIAGQVGRDEDLRST
jgi:enamine deaminase RidA (YjgF/YER057c/UK114 family)